MTKLYYELGLSYQPHDGMKFHPGDTPEKDEIRYSLQKQMPSAESGVLTWELIDTPVVRGMIDAWEDIIRSPFLLWCNTRKSSSKILIGEADNSLFWNYIPLVPMKIEPYKFTVEDAREIITQNQQFGDLCIPYTAMVSRQDIPYNESWEKSLTRLEPIKEGKIVEGPPVLEAMPGFSVDFVLSQPYAPVKGLTRLQRQWMIQNDEVLNDAGYSVMNDLCVVGSYKVGTLVEEPQEAREILQANPFLCRHSIVTEDKLTKNKTKKATKKAKDQ